MTESSPIGTRDRILDAAMRLFGEKGFRGTSVTQIEVAAGLTPGAGGIYHHFKSKDALLAAGLERHLDRLRALSDLRSMFAGLGDPRAELTVIGRYVLAELESEHELLRVMMLESRNPLVEEALCGLVESTGAEFADWLASLTDLPRERVGEIATVGLSALVARQILPGRAVPADVHVALWVEMMLSVLRP
ncbi:TetR/AcrR family transcriptional regulator [Actinocorallia lasiicapitis]